MKKLSQKKMAGIVKALRKEKGFSQEQLSKETGINRLMIGRLENDEYMPSVSQLEKLGEILGFEITDLLRKESRLFIMRSDVIEVDKSGRSPLPIS